MRRLTCYPTHPREHRRPKTRDRPVEQSERDRVCRPGLFSKKLAKELLETFGIEFFAKPKRNMKNKLMRLTDKLLSRKRSIVETVIAQLKNISQIEHSRHRSPTNCFVNIICGLIAYCHQPKKPQLNLDWALPSAA